MNGAIAVLLVLVIAAALYVAYRLKMSQEVAERIDQKAAHVTQVVNQGTALLQSARPLLNGWYDDAKKTLCAKTGVC